MSCVCWFASSCWKNNNFVEDSVDEIIIFILLVSPMAFQFEFYECGEMFVCFSMVNGKLVGIIA